MSYSGGNIVKMGRRFGYLKVGLVACVAMAAIIARPLPAAAGCAESIVKGAAGKIAGLTVVGVSVSDAGVTVSLKKNGEEGLIITGMCLAGDDFVTYQGAYGRPGVSNLSADESAWLGKLFEALPKYPGFKECGEFQKSSKPAQAAVIAAMDKHWSDYCKDDVETRPSSLFTILIVGGVLLLVAAVLAAVFVSRRKRRKAANP